MSNATSPLQAVREALAPEPTPEQIEQERIRQLAAACTIDLAQPLAPPPVAMQVATPDGEYQTLFTAGNFSIITGPAKSRKTYLCSMLLAAACIGQYGPFRCATRGAVIAFDTEQARYKTQQIGQRIARMVGHTPASLRLYSLRTLAPDERLAVIGHVLASTPGIGYVVIDGIVDLAIDPILQADQAQAIIMALMQWSEQYSIHVTCVLHYNKSVTTLLGHLGSFSHRKADAVIEVAKLKDNPAVSTVTAIDCREKEFEPFAFTIDGDGLPQVVDYQQGGGASKSNDQFNPAVITLDTHRSIVAEALPTGQRLTYTGAWRAIKAAITEVAGLTAGDNKAKNALGYYLSVGLIEKQGTGPKAIYNAKD